MRSATRLALVTFLVFSSPFISAKDDVKEKMNTIKAMVAKADEIAWNTIKGLTGLGLITLGAACAGAAVMEHQDENTLSAGLAGTCSGICFLIGLPLTISAFKELKVCVCGEKKPIDEESVLEENK